MPVLKPRTRVVYFRVSEEDFRQLTDLCAAYGARSISELARSAMENMIRGKQERPGDKDDVVETLHAIDRTVTEMNVTLKQLVHTGKGDNGNENA